MHGTLPPIEELKARVQHHVEAIYHENPLDAKLDGLADELLAIMRLDQQVSAPPHLENHWSEQDALLISYGDSLLLDGEKPLNTLQRFLDERASDALSGVHILPFYPWSSDDGFAVMDYSSVNESLGDWEDIQVRTQDPITQRQIVQNASEADNLGVNLFYVKVHF